MRVHFIAIGGAAMHNLALALRKKGFYITGSDDEIFEPSRSRLSAEGLLPEQFGWYPDRITRGLDAVILGMHARKDNPELLKAQELGLKIYSYPEYIYEQSLHKIRVVIGGSHGKTTITSMVMHVLSRLGMDFDYMVGSQVDGFETMVRLTEEAPVIILEGDEYLSSPIDLRSKFLWYKPQIALLTGIAWDHINVFPTWESYVETFNKFLTSMPSGAYLTYFEEDETLNLITKQHQDKIIEPYSTHPNLLKDGVSFLNTQNGEVPLKVFGEHNLQNISGALNICKQIGISDQEFYATIGSFKGAAKRLQTIAETDSSRVFLDFAHSPSKLKATTKAVKDQFTNRKLVACMELHTFSSLKKVFLPQYAHSMDVADVAVVYFNPHTVEHKKLEPVSEQEVFDAFENPKLKVYTDASKIVEFLKTVEYKNCNLLLMTSGNFDGVDLKGLAKELLIKK